jgi:hypothetical protein
LQEFTADDDVELYILTKPFMSGSDFMGDMRNWVREHLGFTEEQYSRLPTLYVISHHLTADDVASLYKVRVM